MCRIISFHESLFIRDKKLFHREIERISDDIILALLCYLRRWRPWPSQSYIELPKTVRPDQTRPLYMLLRAILTIKTTTEGHLFVEEDGLVFFHKHSSNSCYVIMFGIAHNNTTVRWVTWKEQPNAWFVQFYVPGIRATPKNAYLFRIGQDST